MSTVCSTWLRHSAKLYYSNHFLDHLVYISSILILFAYNFFYCKNPNTRPWCRISWLILTTDVNILPFSLLTKCIKRLRFNHPAWTLWFPCFSNFSFFFQRMIQDTYIIIPWLSKRAASRIPPYPLLHSALFLSTCFIILRVFK